MLKNKKLHLLLAVIFTVFAFVITRVYKGSLSIGTMPILSIILLLIAIFNGYPIFIKAYQAVKFKIFGIDLLVSVAAIGALFIEEYWEAIAVTFLFIFGAFLESQTISKTRASIAKLIDLAPSKARVLRNDVETFVSIDEVVKKDTVIVKPGEKIAVDGKILKGGSYVDESNITGESIPLFKDEGDAVFAGTINTSGYLEIEVVKVGSDTTFAKIIELVEEAQDTKADSEKFIEKFARYYTPAIFILAIVVLIISRDIKLALTLLVVACPGALVIATPISIVAGIGSGAKGGLLFKGGNTLESFYKADVIAFDKTGTITKGNLVVSEIYSDSLSDKEIIEIAALGELYSEHPIANAIINKAKAENLNLDTKTELIEIVTGKGIIYKINDKTYHLGNKALYIHENFDESYKELIKERETKGMTTIILSENNKKIGIISLSDEIRLDSVASINMLQNKLRKEVVMLTGDNELVAKSIADQVGIKKYYGSLLPEDKLNIINEYKAKNKNVMMIGDGVNDAPALANATLGVAVGGLGKDIAMDTADVVIMSNKIDSVVDAFYLSKAVKSNILQNLFFAIVTALVLLMGVLTSYVTLSIGMLVHEISVILVILNAMRLLKFSKSGKMN